MELTRTIDGTVFTVSPLGYEETCDLQPLILPILPDLARLWMLFGGEVAKVRDSLSDIGESNVIEVFGVGLAQASIIIADLASKIAPERMRTIRRTLLRGSLIDGAPLYALVEGGPDNLRKMQGRNIAGWKLLIFAFEVNYPDFYRAIRGFVVPAVADGKAASASTSTTATPSAGPVAG